MNYVIANITDEQVKKGEKYPILSMHNGMIDIDVHGTMICFNAEDKDFTVYLNDNENKVYTQEEILNSIKQAIASSPLPSGILITKFNDHSREIYRY